MMEPTEAEADWKLAAKKAAAVAGRRTESQQLLQEKRTSPRRDKVRKQGSVNVEALCEERLRCRRVDSEETSGGEVPFEPRLRRHCSEKGPSSSRANRQKARRAGSGAGGGRGGDMEDQEDGKCSRSLSCRARGPARPTELNFDEPRRRTYSMPSKSKRAFIDVHRAYGGGSAVGSSSGSTPDDFYRVRTFSTSSKGILNRGDSFKRHKKTATGNDSGPEAETKVQETAPSFQHKEMGDGKTVRGNVTETQARAARPSAEPRRRVLVMGGAGVGKRSIMQQFLTSEYMGTFDSSQDDKTAITVSVVLDDEEATLDLIYYPSGLAELTIEDRADAYCIVYSTSDRDSFLYAREILSEIKKKDLQRGAAEILVGNKADLVRQRQVPEDEGKLMAARYKSKFIEVSVVLNHKIDDLLVGIITQIRLKRSTDKKKKSADDSRCYPGRGIVDMILGKQRRQFNSCDNLMVL